MTTRSRLEPTFPPPCLGPRRLAVGVLSSARQKSRWKVCSVVVPWTESHGRLLVSRENLKRNVSVALICDVQAPVLEGGSVRANSDHERRLREKPQPNQPPTKKKQKRKKNNASVPRLVCRRPRFFFSTEPRYSAAQSLTHTCPSRKRLVRTQSLLLLLLFFVSLSV